MAKSGRKYKVRIDSAPPGATVYIDNKQCGPVGVTPWAGSLVNGSYQVIIELDGYQPAQQAFTVVRSRKEQPLFVPLVKKQDPPRIEVRADADKNVFGAQVSLDGQAQGPVPVTLQTTEGRHLIEIKKDGFEPFQQWVDIKMNEKQTLTPQLKEIAKPKNGTIVVEADVPDAEVWLDGNKLPDHTPTVINNVVEGLHVVEVRKEPAIPWKQTVQVTADQQVKVSAGLKASVGGQGGSIRVLSNVNGAHVFLDGVDMGAVPIDIKDAKPGEHIIDVKAPGYQDREEKVTVNAGSAAILKLDLNPTAPKDTGTLKVVSPVPNADVFIDGASVGKVPVEKMISGGEHFVVVQLEGYKKFELKVRLEPGQTQTVSAELKAVGQLRILSTPPGATVLINGLPQGQTPLELKELEVGATVVQIELEDFNQYSETINIEGGKSAVIQATLEKKGASPEEQRGLSSLGARTLPRGHSTVDLGVGFPYFFNARVNVGAGDINEKFGFDAGVGVRSMLTRNEIGLGARVMLVNQDPFTAGAFGDFWWGSSLVDNSSRNGFTVDAGLLASLTALTHVTVTGRLYLEYWNDRHCPALATNGSFDGDPTDACKYYKQVVVDDHMSTDQTARFEKLTGLKGTDFFGRESSARVNLSIAAEIAVNQQYNVWFLLDGAPFQDERALFTYQFSGLQPGRDHGTYIRAGITYKF
ncbi:MAG TPA: PEGA domain-containing protein [Kofleriaceae bacterium]|nr:PEGA domain-containing protein [Kofleriaceae bacterium]